MSSFSVHTIDCQYFFPEVAASYLIQTPSGKGALVEANTTLAAPLILRSIRDKGVRLEDVEYLMVTHAHLDHAGGAGELLKFLPNARLVAHPRAARHLIDPAKLIASASHVYGEAKFAELYGTISPIDAARVKTFEDEEELSWEGLRFRFLHTRGHANHHFVIFEETMRAAFTGDAYGLRYPLLHRGPTQLGRPFVFPSTSPTDFDGPAAIASVERIAALRPHRTYLTHFDYLDETETQAVKKDLIRHLKWGEEQVLRLKLHPEAQAGVLAEMKAYFKAELVLAGVYSEASWELLRLDVELNAQGLVFAAQRK